jgi:hypothetical protein
MAKRFNNLDKALKYLQSPTGGGNNEPPAGSVLANYKEFKTGQSDVSYPVDTNSLPGELLQRQLLPFGAEAADTPAIVTFSSRSQAALGTAFETAAKLSEVSNGVQYQGFFPAQARIFRTTTTGTTNATSQITGIPYKKKSGRNYTLPFGKDGTDTVEKTVRAKIIAESTESDSISFDSEEF